eukprot:TRINITY_DN138_c1_g1_i1.p2 TRINITY_DN138_c1_g1~~TRINITY_DN138_c1_g1_i1.p2  ORF type:complete len:152 (-),score=20.78 TRINITY_DN138_c1_g1_i1:218-673(-)
MAFVGDYGSYVAPGPAPYAPVATSAPFYAQPPVFESGYPESGYPAAVGAVAPMSYTTAPVAPVATHSTVEAWGRPVWKKKWLLGKWQYAGVQDVKYVPRSFAEPVAPYAPVAPVAPVAPFAAAPVDVSPAYAYGTYAPAMGGPAMGGPVVY